MLRIAFFFTSTTVCLCLFYIISSLYLDIKSSQVTDSYYEVVILFFFSCFFLYTISLFLYPAYKYLYELGQNWSCEHSQFKVFAFNFIDSKRVIKNLIKLRKYVGCSESSLFEYVVWPPLLYLAPDTIKKSGVSPQVCHKHNIDIVRTIIKKQLLQLCTAHTVFSIFVTVRLFTVMLQVCRWLTNEKQRKTDIRLTDQQLDVSSNR